MENIAVTMAIPRARARSSTFGERARYDCRVIRELEPGQDHIIQPLGLLAANTFHLVRYDDPGKWHMTLIMLNPLLRQILAPNRRGDIPRGGVQHFETELRRDLDHTRFADYEVKLDPVHPLWLYGKDKNRLGMQLSQDDYRPVGDRAMVEAHLRANYDKPNGDPVSKRFIDQNSLPLKPHVTIGEVRYENMTTEEAELLRKDPTTFLTRAAYDRMDEIERLYGEGCGAEDIVMPEEVSFAGLRVFCERRQ